MGLSRVFFPSKMSRIVNRLVSFKERKSTIQNTCFILNGHKPTLLDRLITSVFVVLLS
jgi:hypothetical protein